MSINLTLGENGIISRAKQAKQLHEEAQIAEEINLKLLEAQAEKGENLTNLTTTELETILSNYGEVQKNVNGEIIGLKPTGKNYTISIEKIYKDTVQTPNIIPTQNSFEVTVIGSNITNTGESSALLNKTYNTTLSVEDGYEIESLTVIMGGKNLVQGTDYDYSDGNLSIKNVIGNIEITVSVTEIVEFDVGDIVAVTLSTPGYEEEFYVMGKDSQNYTLFSRYLIYDSGRQDSSNASKVAFMSGSTPYWTAGQNNIADNDNSIAVKMAVAYGNSLGGTGRLLNYDELNTLTDEVKNTTESIDFWLGTASSEENDMIMYYNCTYFGSFAATYSSKDHYNNTHGVRPVVIVPKALVHEYVY